MHGKSTPQLHGSIYALPQARPLKGVTSLVLFPGSLGCTHHWPEDFASRAGIQWLLCPSPAIVLELLITAVRDTTQHSAMGDQDDLSMLWIPYALWPYVATAPLNCTPKGRGYTNCSSPPQYSRNSIVLCQNNLLFFGQRLTKVKKKKKHTQNNKLIAWLTRTLGRSWEQICWCMSRFRGAEGCLNDSSRKWSHFTR